MRTALYMAIDLAVIVTGVPASLAQDSRVPDQGKSAGIGNEAQERQTRQRPGNERGISVAAPTGRVSVDPELDGEPVYVRRTKVREGMTIVEVSTTPFIPVLASNEGPPAVVRSDQPAGW
jgi:hypothetical protein